MELLGGEVKRHVVPFEDSVNFLPGQAESITELVVSNAPLPEELNDERLLCGHAWFRARGAKRRFNAVRYVKRDVHGFKDTRTFSTNALLHSIATLFRTRPGILGRGD